MEPTQSINVQLTPIDNRRLANLCGQCDAHLRQVEQSLKVDIHSRGNIFEITGEAPLVDVAGALIERLYRETAESGELTAEQVQLLLHEAKYHQPHEKDIVIPTQKGTIKPRNAHQYAYLKEIKTHDLNFGIGPAGTGKTYLAVACAIHALETNAVSKIILVRPAVEAGERLGFLPGDYAQKVDPYLRPLFDALHDMLGGERVNKLIERQVIEVAPLAYMRGRTLNDAFIILDEAQNTTIAQMKMFLTRFGFGSKVVVNGDITQIDLPKGCRSGLAHALDLLKNIKQIHFTYFDEQDVVRHPLVKAIVRAYEQPKE